MSQQDVLSPAHDCSHSEELTLDRYPSRQTVFDLCCLVTRWFESGPGSHFLQSLGISGYAPRTAV
jgi:hypothetical protein